MASPPLNQSYNMSWYSIPFNEHTHRCTNRKWHPELHLQAVMFERCCQPRKLTIEKSGCVCRHGVQYIWDVSPLSTVCANRLQLRVVSLSLLCVVLWDYSVHQQCSEKSSKFSLWVYVTWSGRDVCDGWSRDDRMRSGSNVEKEEAGGGWKRKMSKERRGKETRKEEVQRNKRVCLTEGLSISELGCMLTC